MYDLDHHDTKRQIFTIMSEFSISDDELPISETVEHKQDEALSGETAPESNIAQQFSDSLIALRELIAGLVRQPKETSQPEALISKALEKYSRLNTWGEETRAAYVSFISFSRSCTPF